MDVCTGLLVSLDSILITMLDRLPLVERFSMISMHVFSTRAFDPMHIISKPTPFDSQLGLRVLPNRTFGFQELARARNRSVYHCQGLKGGLWRVIKHVPSASSCQVQRAGFDSLQERWVLVG